MDTSAENGETRGENDPATLLARFVDAKRSEQAFEALVRRCGGLVYASALRRTGNVQTAEEVTQNVFAILARKAASLRRHPSLTAWMFQTTKFEAAKAMRSEQRRKRKLNALAEEAALRVDELSDADRAAWRDALPVLDESLDRLHPSERELLLQRFFEGRKFREIAAAHGKSEAACKMQVKRVLGKLSQWLSARGVTLSAATLATCLGAELAKAAPAGVVAAASSGGLAAAGGVTAGTLLTNTLQTMSAVKTATITTVAVAAMASAPFFWQQSEAKSLRRELGDLGERRTLAGKRHSDAASAGAKGLPDAKTGDAAPQRSIRQLLAAADEPIDAKSLMDGMMRVWMTQDIMGMLRIFLPISRLTSDELDALLAEVKEADANPQVKQMALQLLTMFGDGGDPALALERGLEMNLEPYAYGQQLTGWAKEDPQAALAWFRARQEEGALAGKGVGRTPESILFGMLLGGIVTTDTELALRLFNEADGDTRRHSIRQMISSFVYKGEDARPQLREFIEGLGEREKNQAVQEAATNIAMRESWDAALAYAESFGLNDDRRMHVLTSVATSDPSKGVRERIDWVLANAPEEMLPNAVESVVQSMGWQNSAGLDQWVDAQPRGEVRDSAQAARAQHLASRQQFEEGMRRALDIDEESKRNNAVRGVVAHWKGRDESAAREAVARAGLDPAAHGLGQPAATEN